MLKDTLLKARNFHKELRENKHSNTWLIYSIHDSEVWDKVQWKSFYNKRTYLGVRRDIYNTSKTKLQMLKGKTIEQEKGDGKITLPRDPQDSR